jgi:hypothetical protein
MDIGGDPDAQQRISDKSPSAIVEPLPTASTSSAAADDGDSASDEVKVYVEEGEGVEPSEAKANEGQQRDFLSDDKSNLITESEQSKDARRNDLAFSKQP